MSKLKYLNTCASVDAMDRIASKTYLRLSYEYGICLLKRELIPTFASICLKSLISNISSLRTNNEDAAYINLFDLITFGLVELNFDETEKATNILPDFRIGSKGCRISGMNFEKYNQRQVPLENYDCRILNVASEDYNNTTWMDLAFQMGSAIYSNVGFVIEDRRVLSVFLEIFLEEMLYDLGMHIGQKDYAYKLFDILYFNDIGEKDLWGTDVMPEYKLMVKNDSYSESLIEEDIKSIEEKEDKYKKGLYWNK